MGGAVRVAVFVAGAQMAHAFGWMPAVYATGTGRAVRGATDSHFLGLSSIPAGSVAGITRHALGAMAWSTAARKMIVVVSVTDRICKLMLAVLYLLKLFALQHDRIRNISCVCVEADIRSIIYLYFLFQGLEANQSHMVFPLPYKQGCVCVCVCCVCVYRLLPSSCATVLQ